MPKRENIPYEKTNFWLPLARKNQKPQQQQQPFKITNTELMHAFNNIVAVRIGIAKGIRHNVHNKNNNIDTYNRMHGV